jgi:hypothetical protein
MGRLVLYMSMSLDGFIAGPGATKANPFGAKGHRLHERLGDGGEDPSGFRPGDEPSRTVADELMSTGAVVTGRRTETSSATGAAIITMACRSSSRPIASTTAMFRRAARSSSPTSKTAPGRPGPRRAIVR